MKSKKKYQVSDFPRNRFGAVHGRFNDLTGQTFGRLKVVSFWGSVKRKQGTVSYWNCICDCGENIVTQASGLRNGQTSSCGCYNKEISRKNNGLRYHYLYPVWQQMNRRCNNPLAKQYKDYGGRGISVCWDWHEDNPNGLLNYVNDLESKLGPRPEGFSLDRWPDPNGNYEINNVRYVCRTLQNLNQRRSHGFSYSRLYQAHASFKKRMVLCDEWNEFKNMLRDIGDEIPEGMYLNRKDITKPFGPDNWLFSTKIQKVRNRKL